LPSNAYMARVNEHFSRPRLSEDLLSGTEDVLPTLFNMQHHTRLLGGVCPRMWFQLWVVTKHHNQFAQRIKDTRLRMI